MKWWLVLLLVATGPRASAAGDFIDEILNMVRVFHGQYNQYYELERLAPPRPSNRAQQLKFYLDAARITSRNATVPVFLEHTYDAFEHLQPGPAEIQSLLARLTYSTVLTAPFNTPQRYVMDRYLKTLAVRNDFEALIAAVPSEFPKKLIPELKDHASLAMLTPPFPETDHERFMRAYNAILHGLAQGPWNDTLETWEKREIGKVDAFTKATHDLYRRHRPSVREMVESAHSIGMPPSPLTFTLETRHGYRKIARFVPGFDRHPQPMLNFLLAQLEYDSPLDDDFQKADGLFVALKDETEKGKRWRETPLHFESMSLSFHETFFTALFHEMAPKIFPVYERRLSRQPRRATFPITNYTPGEFQRMLTYLAPGDEAFRNMELLKAYARHFEREPPPTIAIWRELFAHNLVDATAAAHGALKLAASLSEEDRAGTREVFAALKKAKPNLPPLDRIRLAHLAAETDLAGRATLRRELAQIARDENVARLLGQKEWSPELQSAMAAAFPEGESDAARAAMLVREMVLTTGVPEKWVTWDLLGKITQGEPDLAAVGIARALHAESRRLRWTLGNFDRWLGKSAVRCGNSVTWRRLTGD